MFEDNKHFMQRFVQEAINKKNLNAIDELVAEDLWSMFRSPVKVLDVRD